MPLLQKVEGVPERLEEIVAKCLAKEKGERYQTAKDLLIDLRNLRRKLDIDAEIERTVVPAQSSISGGAKEDTAKHIDEAQTVIFESAEISERSRSNPVSKTKLNWVLASSLILVVLAGAFVGTPLLHVQQTDRVDRRNAVCKRQRRNRRRICIGRNDRNTHQRFVANS